MPCPNQRALAGDEHDSESDIRLFKEKDFGKTSHLPLVLFQYSFEFRH
jgi:hypothetical protein